MKRGTAKARALFGRGSYTIPEAARLLRAPVRKVRRWAAGYTFTGDGAPRFSEPLIQREWPTRHGLIELSFLDLIELLFIKSFHAQGVSLPVIRRTAKRAANLFGTNHPFCVQSFKTDGETIFAQMQREAALARVEGDSHTIDLRSGQHVFEVVVAPFFKQFVYDVDTKVVRQWYPLGTERHVIVDPALGFGEPAVPEHGIPTRALKRAAMSGRRIEEIADWYAVSVDAVGDAIKFEDALSNAA